MERRTWLQIKYKIMFILLIFNFNNTHSFVCVTQTCVVLKKFNLWQYIPII